MIKFFPRVSVGLLLLQQIYGFAEGKTKSKWCVCALNVLSQQQWLWQTEEEGQAFLGRDAQRINACKEGLNLNRRFTGTRCSGSWKHWRLSGNTTIQHVTMETSVVATDVMYLLCGAVWLQTQQWQWCLIHTQLKMLDSTHSIGNYGNIDSLVPNDCHINQWCISTGEGGFHNTVLWSSNANKRAEFLMIYFRHFNCWQVSFLNTGEKQNWDRSFTGF